MRIGDYRGADGRGVFLTNGPNDPFSDGVTIASNLFDCTDKGLYDFAVHHLGGDAGRPQGALLRLGLPAMKRERSSITSELTPQHVLIDLFDSDDFPVPIPDPKAAAEIIVQRLMDAGFEVRPAERCRP